MAVYVVYIYVCLCLWLCVYICVYVCVCVYGVCYDEGELRWPVRCLYTRMCVCVCYDEVEMRWPRRRVCAYVRMCACVCVGCVCLCMFVHDFGCV